MATSGGAEKPIGPYELDVEGVEEQLALWSIRVVSWTYRIDEHRVREGVVRRTIQYELESDNRAVRFPILMFDIVHRDEDGRVCIYDDMLRLWGSRWTSGRPLTLIEEQGDRDGRNQLKVEPGARISHSELIANPVPFGLDPDIDPYEIDLGFLGIELPSELCKTLREQEIDNLGELLQTPPSEVERLPKVTAKRVRLLRESLRLHRFEWSE